MELVHIKDYEEYLVDIIDEISEGRVLCQIEKEWNVFHSVVFFILMHEFHNEYLAEKETCRYYEEVKFSKEKFINFFISKDFSTGCIRYNHFPSPFINPKHLENMFEYYVSFSSLEFQNDFRTNYLAESHAVTVVQSTSDIDIMRAHYVRGNGVIFAPIDQFDTVIQKLSGLVNNNKKIPPIPHISADKYFGLRTVRSGAYLFTMDSINWDMYNVFSRNYRISEDSIYSKKKVDS